MIKDGQVINDGVTVDRKESSRGRTESYTVYQRLKMVQRKS